MERRNFIKGSAAVALSGATIAPAAAAVAVSTPPIAATTAEVDRTAWEHARAALAKIEAEDAAFTPGWLEAYKRCEAECEAILHITLRPDPYTGRKAPVSTADHFAVAYGRKMVADLASGKRRHDDLPDLKEHEQLNRDLVAAADRRGAKVQAIRDRYDMDRLDDKAEAFGDALSEAQGVLMAIPAPDLRALRWKIDHLTYRGESWDSWSDDYVRQVNADIVRLMPEAG